MSAHSFGYENARMIALRTLAERILCPTKTFDWGKKEPRVYSVVAGLSFRCATRQVLTRLDDGITNREVPAMGSRPSMETTNI